MKLPKIEKAIVALDTETTGLHRDDGARLFCVSVARDEKARSWRFAEPDQEFKQLAVWLQSQQLVLANAKFDLHMFDAWGFDLSGSVVWDTAIATMLLEPGQSVGLKETAARLWGEDEKAEKEALDAWFKSQKVLKKDRRYDSVPWEILEPYATKDAALTLKLFYWQEQAFVEMDDPELNNVFRREMELSKVLFQMERRGIGFDGDACLKSAQTLQLTRALLASELPFKPGITQAKEFFFGPEGEAIPHMELTATGKPKLDEEMLARLVQEGVEWASEYQKLRNMDSALSKWYENWPHLMGVDGRLRTVFNQTNVRSGRLSVSRVQLQAIPHDNQLPTGVSPLRSFFRAKDGHELWELDLSQAEIRVAAYYAKCRAMVETLRMAGADVHGATARMVFNVDDESEDWDFLRAVAKRINFGIIYGAGPRTIREQIHKFTGVDAPLAQVEMWVREYRQTYPQFGAFSGQCEVKADERGFVKLKGGRRRWFQDYEGRHKAFNAVIQGSVAEVMKEWMIQIEVQYPGILLLQIHDSVVLEIEQGRRRKGGMAESEVVDTIAAMGEKLFSERFNRPNREDLWIDFVVDYKPWEGLKATELEEEDAA